MRRVRLWPRSLLGQTLLATALALLVAQCLTAYLMFRAAEERRETALLTAAAFQLIGGQRFAGPPPGLRETGAEVGAGERRAGARRLLREARGRQGFPRRLHYRDSPASPLLPGEARQPAREAALRELLTRQDIAVAQIVVTERALARDPVARAMAAASPRLRQRLAAGGERKILVAGLRRESAGRWEVARVPLARRDSRLLPAIVVQTVVLFVVLMGLLWLVLRRITRPLAQLRARTSGFAGRGAPLPPLPLAGPSDVSSLIAAHNAMEARIGAMLDEKDVMLGAIGHDLKTPLAALRVRIETVPDEGQRAQMAATIEEVTRTLDEILELARAGRADSPPERAELSALAASVVEEFEDLGEPVMMVEGPRLGAPVHVAPLKRALRNLVANAVRYGGKARVTVLRDADGAAVLRVEDTGPGIPAERIEAMMEPFVRGETSRNRATGGAGLGLTLARAVATQHGGQLVLGSREGGGLRAEIRLPAPPQGPAAPPA